MAEKTATNPKGAGPGGRTFGAKTSPRILREKARPIIKALIKHKLNKAAAAKEVGLSTAAIHVRVNHDPYVREGIKPMLDALYGAGATEEKYARVISEGMDAEKTSGVIGATTKEPDHAIRLKAGEHYAKLKRYVTGDDGGVVNNKLIVIIGEKGLDEII